MSLNQWQHVNCLTFGPQQTCQATLFVGSSRFRESKMACACYLIIQISHTAYKKPASSIRLLASVAAYNNYVMLVVLVEQQQKHCS